MSVVPKAMYRISAKSYQNPNDIFFAKTDFFAEKKHTPWMMVVAAHTDMFNTTELYIEKLLRWQNLCYVYFTTIKNLKKRLITKRFNHPA